MNITHTEDIEESTYATKALLLVEFIIFNPKNDTLPFLAPGEMYKLLKAKEDEITKDFGYPVRVNIYMVLIITIILDK